MSIQDLLQGYNGLNLKAKGLLESGIGDALQGVGMLSGNNISEQAKSQDRTNKVITGIGRNVASSALNKIAPGAGEAYKIVSGITDKVFDFADSKGDCYTDELGQEHCEGGVNMFNTADPISLLTNTGTSLAGAIKGDKRFRGKKSDRNFLQRFTGNMIGRSGFEEEQQEWAMTKDRFRREGRAEHTNRMLQNTNNLRRMQQRKTTPMFAKQYAQKGGTINIKNGRITITTNNNRRSDPSGCGCGSS